MARRQVTLPFTEEVQTYTILVLSLDEYRAMSRSLPEGFTFLQPDQAQTVRAQEMRILKQHFDDWNVPYHRQLKGWRPESPIFVVQKENLVGGVYLCDRNEFDDDPVSGQLHYAFMAPEMRGQGIYSAIFSAAVHRARDWGLERLYLNSDRHLLPEVYLRWGAQPWRIIEKSSHWMNTRLARIILDFHPGLRFLPRRLVRAWRSLREAS